MITDSRKLALISDSAGILPIVERSSSLRSSIAAIMDGDSRPESGYAVPYLNQRG